MTFDLPTIDPRLARDLCRLLENLADPDPAARIRLECEAIKPGVRFVRVFPADVDRPIRAFVAWIDLTLVLYGGVTALAHATRYTEAISFQTDFSDLGGGNRWLNRKAEDDWTYIRSVPELDNLSFILAGHSIGGGFAEMLAIHLRSSVTPSIVSLTTFGSPRPGPETCTRLLASVEMTRWMNEHDPVPNVPPRQAEAPLWYAVLSARGRTNANRYSQPQGGLMLHADGSLSAIDTPPFIPGGLQGNLAAWILLSSSDVNTVHSLVEYQRRLASRVEAIGATNPFVPGTPQREHVLERLPRAMRQEADQFEAALRTLIREANAGPLIIPPSRQFVAVKRKRLWAVELRGGLVMLGPERKRARHIAFLGNQWLDAMQRMGRVDVDAMLLEIGLYLADAGDPLGAFRPTMRIR